MKFISIVVILGSLVICQCNCQELNQDSNNASRVVTPAPNKMVEKLANLAKHVLPKLRVKKESQNSDKNSENDNKKEISLDDWLEESEFIIDVPPPLPEDYDDESEDNDSNKPLDSGNVDNLIKELAEIENAAVKIEADANGNQDDKYEADDEGADHYHHLHPDEANVEDKQKETINKDNVV